MHQSKLSIEEVRSLGALAESAHEVDNELGVLADTLLVAIVAVDEHEQAARFKCDFRAFVVAGRSAHSALGIAINGQSLDVQHSATDALVRLSGTTNAERKRVADEFRGVETTNRIAETNAREVD